MKEQKTPSELLDIVDIDGTPTGEQQEKSVIHRGGLWHRDVHVWITNGWQLLEQQRAAHKKIMPKDWDVSVGGHVAAGEDFLTAAMRETEEELGLRFVPERFMPAGRLAVEMAMEDGAWVHRVVGDNFVVMERDLTLKSLTLQTSEVMGARLYSIDQLERDLTRPETAVRHAQQPPELWALGIAAMRAAAA